MIRLFETNFCPYCDIVKETLEELKLDYKIVSVPSPHHLRTEVQELSGQSLVPIIVDEGEVITDSRRIINYLQNKYAHNN